MARGGPACGCRAHEERDPVGVRKSGRSICPFPSFSFSHCSFLFLIPFFSFCLLSACRYCVLWALTISRPAPTLDEVVRGSSYTHMRACGHTAYHALRPMMTSHPSSKGFGLRLRPTDPIDPAVAFFGGIGVQCAFFSKEHNAIVVSMGDDFGGDCKQQVWEQARNSIVSKDYAGKYAVTNQTHSTLMR